MDPYEPYWRLLELEPGAGAEELKRAYREQAKTWHPDRFPYDAELRRRCEERMALVNQAYEALGELIEGGAPPEPAWEGSSGADLQAWAPAPETAQVPSSPDGIPGFAALPRIAAALALAAAALAALFVLPNQTAPAYWTLMRLVAGPALAYAAVAAAARGVWEVGLAWGLLALALNPVLPVPMGLEEWRLFNGLTPPLLGAMLLWMQRRSP